MQPRLVLVALTALIVSACSGSTGKAGVDGPDGKDGVDGKTGPAGKDGADGAKGATGANGKDGTNGTNGNDIILSENARLGLSISKVAVDLTGLDGDQTESVGRGAYLVNAVADCQGCHNGSGAHGETLFLAGNVDFPIGGFTSVGAPCTPPAAGCTDGHVFTRNLTPDKTTGLKLSEDQFVKALRTGMDFKDATGATSLIVMPWAQLRWLTDRDLRDVYHYLKQIPAVSNPVQSDVKPKFAPNTALFYASNGKPLATTTFGDGATNRPLPAAFDPVAGKPTNLAAEEYDGNDVLRGLAISPLADDATAAALTPSQQALYGRGSYIVNGPGLCNECHTVGGRNKMTHKVDTTHFLAGGQAFAVPPPLQPILGQVRTMSANLTGDLYGFTLPYAGFLDTWLSGVSFTSATPHTLGFPMPFDVFRNMTNQDKEAVYTYITTIQKATFITGDKKHQAPARYCAVVGDCEVGEACTSITINGAPTKECTGAACTADSDCGACQKCDTSVTLKCLAEDPASACVTSSL